MERSSSTFASGEWPALNSSAQAAKAVGEGGVPLARSRGVFAVRREKQFRSLQREIGSVLKSEVLQRYAHSGST
jgi:hypothetical protein